MSFEHGAIQLFREAYGCGHPEPNDDTTTEWADWDGDHPMSCEGYRLCLLDPMGTGCPACTETVADQEDLPEGEYVTCRQPQVSQ